MWPSFAKLNTLRNQMLFGFLLVMVAILAVVGAVTFNSVSTMLKTNAEKHIQETAVQANGRLEGILDQYDTLTTLLATDADVQKLLLKERKGVPASFTERQALPQTIKNIQLYMTGVLSIELYSQKQNRRLYPLSDGKLGDKVSQAWIDQATAAKGEIVWFGTDPADSGSLVALKRISLIDDDFATGGYLLLRVDRKVFEFKEPLLGGNGQETLLLVGRNGNLLAANDASITEIEADQLMTADSLTVTLGDTNYILVRQRSSVTGWTLLILTPVKAITEGVSVLRATILVTAGIGAILFILLSLLLSTAITRPILRLIKTMRGARLGVLKPAEIVGSTIEINELNHTYNQMVNNINQLIKLMYEKEILQSQTELKALQAQINPHFLFNTLEALYWSLEEKDEHELAAFVLAMSDLFRYTITRLDNAIWVTLRDELEHIEKYMLIMKHRLGDRLTWKIACPPEVGSVRLPKLLIQPFVENAVLHGVGNKIGPGVVKLIVKRTEDREHLDIIVEDDGPGMDEETVRNLLQGLETGQVASTKKSGLGIANVQRRIRLYYKNEHPDSVDVRSRKGAGTSVRIRVPIAGGYYENEDHPDRR